MTHHRTKLFHHLLDERITVDRRDAGAAADFDVVRAQALSAQVRASLPPLIGQRQSALFQLAQLLGRPPGGAPPGGRPSNCASWNRAD